MPFFVFFRCRISGLDVLHFGCFKVLLGKGVWGASKFKGFSTGAYQGPCKCLHMDFRAEGLRMRGACVEIASLGI